LGDEGVLLFETARRPELSVEAAEETTDVIEHEMSADETSQYFSKAVKGGGSKERGEGEERTRFAE
jgi:hypothetical protein